MEFDAALATMARLRPFLASEQGWRALPPEAGRSIAQQVTEALEIYAQACAAIPLLPEYEQWQQGLTAGILEFLLTEPGMKELMTSWPVFSSQSYNVYQQERAIDPGFHKALQAIVPQLQSIANRHAALAGVSPARVEIYESDCPDCEQRANGYADRIIGFPSSSIIFEDFPNAAMFIMHEATHHIQGVLQENYLASRLSQDNWMHRQGALFVASRGGINPSWYDPRYFEGATEPYEASRKAYAARPAERDALMRGDFIEAELRNPAFIT